MATEATRGADAGQSSGARRRGRTPWGWIIGGVIVVCVLLVAQIFRAVGGGESDDAHRASTAAAVETVATFHAVIDGDTIDTSEGRVRIIGIDTPEREECGYGASSAALEAVVAPGDPVALVLPPGQNDRDRYDRLLRYVVTESGVDLGLMQIEQGHAVARYDSLDGYPRHPHESAYREAQTATLDPRGTVVPAHCR